uniref:Uncharacterized protein n=1 Tax=Eucampia antarctica TaxID=49252 RepID=A0A7S2S509_9STRA|mmetsp:Transcript_31153/g.30001  ORF Transcript_31153/g.30001 Transcript_31153/m.30001 type:complete len:279 (+) Transcript_31153:256-1092(+)|eukprot:CAMPEP_0197837196 /NCGR_PEP_ID=MMETSP1437-20131217/31425_1 /TAXON_ID=49252 ORGANISM="Eucampia antarctica, Strain CCMP1452" /NCGR_SAMPLE_ID=MMETSP1437 /ASSEMBLY_ACC=CAM_ASM_001096 /LENGTH=278 /DNA_ID=CAMNT_0043444041 /DNA_START=256 /DNA_END=1092 /DNA_ORIENTATION=-
MDDDANYDPDTARVCKLYDSEDGFTAFVQILLAFMCLASLWIKRHFEKPRRKFMTWFFDVFKQGFGAAYGHVLNMIIAAIIADNVRGDSELEDQCAWYAINFFIDTTVGLFLSVLLLKVVDRMAKEHGWDTLKDGGIYVGPHAFKTWAHQLLAWIVILSIVKTVLCFLLWVFSPILAIMGGIIFAPLQSNIRFELLFIMIILPAILNMFYFWIADSYLKAEGEHEGTHEIDPKKKNLDRVETDSDYVAMEGNVNLPFSGKHDTEILWAKTKCDNLDLV